MKLIKTYPLFSLLNSYLIDSPQPVNISYLWNFGSLLGICLVIQIISGIILACLLDLATNFSFETNIQTSEYLPCLFSLIHLKLNNFKSKLQQYLCSFDFIKGIKFGLSLPSLPAKLEAYHSSLLGRTMRVIGGICALILIYNQQKYFYSTESILLLVVYILIIVLGLSHLGYMFTIFFVRLLYNLYYILTGKWIHRNSPLKSIMSEGSGVIICVKGFCMLTGGYFTMAAAANSLDNILDESYFRELAIIKEPALQLKAFSKIINNNITIGPKDQFPEKTEQESTSKIIVKLKEYEELSKFKSLLSKTSEFKAVFDEIKKEHGADIISDIRLEIDKLKKPK